MKIPHKAGFIWDIDKLNANNSQYNNISAIDTISLKENLDNLIIDIFNPFSAVTTLSQFHEDVLLYKGATSNNNYYKHQEPNQR